MIEVYVIGNNDNSFQLEKRERKKNIFNLKRLLRSEFDSKELCSLNSSIGGACYRYWSTWHNLNNKIEGNAWLIKYYLTLIRHGCAWMKMLFSWNFIPESMQIILAYWKSNWTKANIFNWFGYGFLLIFDDTLEQV